MIDDDGFFDAEIGIRTSCQFCSWKSESYPYGPEGEQKAEDELAVHQIKGHPRAPGGTRIGVYDDSNY